MWFNRKKPPPIRSLVGDGMAVHGDMTFTEGLRIDGQVFGDVVAEGEGRSILVISDNARVHGRVSASHVIINGEVHGPVASTEMLELQPKARIEGDVHYTALEMHQGALVSGQLRPIVAGEEKPTLKLAANNA